MSLQDSTDSFITLTCEQCNNTFTRPSWRKSQRFCGRACSARSRRTRVERICPICSTHFLGEPHRIAIGWDTYCSFACKSIAQSTHDIERYLLAHRQVDPITDCWLWTGKLERNGYARVRIKGRNISVHRLAAMHYLGFDLNSRKFVCHHCDTPRCFNPTHLFIGSARDNTHDAHTKGRLSPPPRNHLRGDMNPSAKLSDLDVQEIRKLADNGVKGSILAQQFGVESTTVYRIIHQKNWTHVL